MSTSQTVEQLAAIAERIHATFARKDAAREKAFALSRQVVREAAATIKTVHRGDLEQARAGLARTGALVQEMLQAVADTPDLRFGGFVGDAEKEYAEAAITLAAVAGDPLPTPEELKIEQAPWLNGLAEAGGEFRRHVLDLIRQDQPERAEAFLELMDDIYHCILGFDYPNAISLGLRGRADALRGMIERTRGDLTNALRQARLERRLARLSEQ